MASTYFTRFYSEREKPGEYDTFQAFYIAVEMKVLLELILHKFVKEIHVVHHGLNHTNHQISGTMKNEDIDKVILAALAGVAGGVILGLLFAPDKGSKTRKKLTKKSDDYLKEIKKDLEELRKYLNKRTEATKSEIDYISRNARKKGEEILKKTKKMASYDEWTKEELYERAKQKEIDGYSTMNKSELIEALKNS